MPRTALLLIAHGSRRAEANAELEALAAEIRRRGGFHFVQPAYLELAEPTIVAGAEKCINAGTEVIVLLPYFLSPGVHVTEDLTAARADLADRFPKVAVRLAPPIGLHPLLADIVIQRAGEAAE
jgi:sirohydrochlorin ferrochelatase